MPPAAQNWPLLMLKVDPTNKKACSLDHVVAYMELADLVQQYLLALMLTVDDKVHRVWVYALERALAYRKPASFLLQY
ncbi:hypothetical protein CRT38_01757 [Anaplasma phagocytophilum str. CRT38]|uniref:Uncharacterized protein n=1 Tax=Anaplasma phagocytophilum str. CRT38 TaxID=1269275 RepID=S6G5B7_ANAPH|nr:hypothetical protein CRT38_01757 [Anaplasma phagocytophilum str. CRT38]